MALKIGFEDAVRLVQAQIPAGWQIELDLRPEFTVLNLWNDNGELAATGKAEVAAIMGALGIAKKVMEDRAKQLLKKKSKFS